MDGSKSPVREFYRDAGVLVTGATGFLGKIIIEKLLRSCPDVKRLYLVIRTKKGKSPEARIKELFEDVVFQEAKKENPDYLSKVVAVPGDCSLPQLGLSAEDYHMLINNVHIVFHGAATVRFDEHLKLAYAINVFGTQEVLKLCKGMHNLKSLVHISTAYSNCAFDPIEEKCYEPPMDHRKLASLTSELSTDEITRITPTVLGKWPNTYAFTKALAENLVKQEEESLPVTIFRPAIVTSTCKEPLKGWIDNLYGPTGILVGAGTGVLRSLTADIKINANLVPVDFVVNGILVAAKDTAEKYRSRKEVRVYNYVSTNENKLLYEQFMNLLELYGWEFPSKRAIWFYSLTITKSYYLSLLLTITLHFIPGFLMDGVLILMGKKPIMTRIYMKIYKFNKAISYFSTKEWTFKDDNIKSLWKDLSDEDRNTFTFDIKQVDWDRYLYNYIKGARLYLMKEPMSTLPQAERKWKRLYWCHQGVKTVFALLLIRLTWIFFSGLVSPAIS